MYLWYMILYQSLNMKVRNAGSQFDSWKQILIINLKLKRLAAADHLPFEAAQAFEI